MKYLSRSRMSVPRRSPVLGLSLFLLAIFAGLVFLIHGPLGKGGSTEFNHFLSDTFIQETSSNTMNLHFTLSDPASAGITDYDVTFGDYSAEGRKSSLLATKQLRQQLDDFSYRSLTEDEQIVYDVLSDYLDRQLALSDYPLFDEVLTPSGGATSQLPILLAEYRFHSAQDVEDYLALLSQMDTYFDQILAYEQEKADAGLFMSDSCCRKVIESCEVFTLHPDDNFLITTFDNRLDQMEGISDGDKADYRKRNQTAIAEHVIPAYQNIASGLTKLMGRGRNDWGLCNYEDGCAYYSALVAYYTGCDDTVEELFSQIEEKRTADLAVCSTLLSEKPSLLLESDSVTLDYADEAAMVQTLENAIAADFPEVPDNDWELVHVDPALSDYLAPAFYITAPIDNYKSNRIYLNTAANYDSLGLFTTLAHEGFPGHLYQTVCSYAYGMNPLHTLLNYPGYTEGWATYVEMQSYYYAGLDEDMASLLQHNQSVMLSLYATSDIGIHYYGWEKDEMMKLWSGYGITDEATVEAITNLILEEPGNYLKYYVGYMKFTQLREACETKQKGAFDPVQFHEEIMRIGPAPFKLLEEKLVN